VPERRLRREYRRRLWQLLRRRPEAAVLRIYAVKTAMHYHAHEIARTLRGGRVINTY